MDCIPKINRSSLRALARYFFSARQCCQEPGKGHSYNVTKEVEVDKTCPNSVEFRSRTSIRQSFTGKWARTKQNEVSLECRWQIDR